MDIELQHIIRVTATVTDFVQIDDPHGPSDEFYIRVASVVGEFEPARTGPPGMRKLTVYGTRWRARRNGNHTLAPRAGVNSWEFSPGLVPLALAMAVLTMTDAARKAG